MQGVEKTSIRPRRCGTDPCLVEAIETHRMLYHTGHRRCCLYHPPARTTAYSFGWLPVPFETGHEGKLWVCCSCHDSLMYMRSDRMSSSSTNSVVDFLLFPAHHDPETRSRNEIGFV